MMGLRALLKPKHLVYALILKGYQQVLRAKETHHSFYGKILGHQTYDASKLVKHCFIIQ